jgi:hypothetical protein
MNSLLQRTLDAHGGLERWRRFEHVSAHLRNGGVLWALKQQQGVIDDVKVRVALRREWASHSPFGEPSWRTSFEPHRVAIETTDGRVVAERMIPRESARRDPGRDNRIGRNRAVASGVAAGASLSRYAAVVRARGADL